MFGTIEYDLITLIVTYRTPFNTYNNISRIK